MVISNPFQVFSMPQDSNYCMNNLMNFSINLNVDYSQSETTVSNFDKDATPQQIYPGICWTTKWETSGDSNDGELR